MLFGRLCLLVALWLPSLAGAAGGAAPGAEWVAGFRAYFDREIALLPDPPERVAAAFVAA
jgi:hypothetical protein